MRYFLLILGLFFTPILSAQFHNWKAFLSPEQVNDSEETSDAFWLATDAGVIKIDKLSGEKTHYTTNNANLKSNHIQAIARDAYGDIWIGTYDVEVSRFDGNNFTNQMSPDLPTNLNEDVLLYDFQLTDANNVWIGTSEGVYQRQNEEWILHNHDNGPSLLSDTWKIEIVADGSIYAVSLFTYQYDGEEWKGLSDTTDLFIYEGAQTLKADDGTFWLNNLGHIMGQFDGEHWKLYRTSDPSQWAPSPPSSNLREMVQTSTGDILLATMDNGIYRLEGEIWVRQDMPMLEAFLPHHQHLFLDSEDRFWVNTSNELHRLDGQEFSTYHLPEFGLANNYIRSLRQDHTGKIYILSHLYVNTIVTYDQGIWGIMDLSELSLGDYYLYDIDFPAVGHIAITTSKGLSYFDGTIWTQYTHPNPIGGITYWRKMAHDQNGTLYLCSQNGLFRFEQGDIMHYNTTNSPLPENYVVDVVVDHHNKLWLRTLSEILSLEGEEWINHSLNNNLIVGLSGRFSIDVNNNLWIPSYLDRVIHYDGEQWKVFDHSNSSLNVGDRTYSIASTADGKVHCIQDEGIALFDGESWSFIERETTGIPNLYGTDAMVDQEQRIWLGTPYYGLYRGEAMTPTATHFLPAVSKILVSPNPSTDHISFSYTLDRNTVISLRLLDSKGSQVWNQSYGLQNTGDHQITFDIQHLAPGTYFAVLQQGELSSLEVIVKQ